MFEADVKSIHQDENTLTLQLYTQPELEYFKGHFPGRPILPGVVQTHWAIHYGAIHLGLPEKIKKLEVIKFKNLIQPEMDITLKLELKANGKLSFSYLSGDNVMSSGRIVYPES